MLSVEISTIIIFLLSLILAFYLTLNYFNTKKISYIFWGSGMWAFAVGVILEVFFAFGAYNEALIKLYLFIVAILVELLAIGSINLTGNKHFILTYYIYSIASTLALIISLIYTGIGYILTEGFRST